MTVELTCPWCERALAVEVEDLDTLRCVACLVEVEMARLEDPALADAA